MKAERLIRILIQLQKGEVISTRTLAHELEVSERTVHRDMESLSAAGIPIFSERGKAGGWRLVDDWKQKLSWLKVSEILSLFLPISEKVLKDLNIDISKEELKQKLLLSVPKSVRKNASDIWERIHIDMETWRESSHTVQFIKELEIAVMNDYITTIDYKKASGEMKSYKLEPLGLVAKGSTWYLIALNEQKAFRTYNLSRILSCAVSTTMFSRPLGFNLSEYWKQSKRAFIKNLPEYQVIVSVSPMAMKRLMFTGKFVQHLEEPSSISGHQWEELSLSFPTEEEALNFILGFGNQLKVVSPSQLVNKLIARAEDVLALYKSDGSPTYK